MNQWQRPFFLLIVSALVLISSVQAFTYVTYNVNASHDGYVSQYGNISWAALRHGAGSGVVNNPIGDNEMGILANDTFAFYNTSDRMILSFDMTGIPDDAIIDTASVTVWGTAKANGLGAFNVSLIDCYPASSTTYVAGDYDATTYTLQSYDITYANWHTDNINVYPLNSNGLPKINGTGIVSFMIADNYTVTDTDVWIADAYSYALAAPLSSTSKPYLTVVYHLPESFGDSGTGGSSILAALNMAGLLIVVTGIVGLVYSLMGVGGFGGGRSSYNRGSGINTTVLIASITAILIGSVLLILTYTVIDALITAAGI